MALYSAVILLVVVGLNVMVPDYDYWCNAKQKNDSKSIVNKPRDSFLLTVKLPSVNVLIVRVPVYWCNDFQKNNNQQNSQAVEWSINMALYSTDVILQSDIRLNVVAPDYWYSAHQKNDYKAIVNKP